MKTKPSLKKPNEESSPIWITLSDGRDVNIKVYTGITIKTKHWSKLNFCVLSANQDAVAINAYLKDLQKQITDIYLSAKGNNIQPDAKFIKSSLDNLKKTVTPLPEKLNFWQIWDLYLVSNKNRFKEGSFLKFNALKNHLLDFEKKRKFSFHFDSINSFLLEDLQNFFYEIQELNTQTTAKYIDIFKMVLKWSLDNDYTTNAEWRKFKPIQQKETLKIILTNDELNLIRKADLKELNHLKNVRELLILSCYTGLRHSDYSRIKAEHYKMNNDGTPTLSIRQEKTGDFVEIPLTPEAQKIVEKIISGKIHNITNQKMNLYLKELCKIAKIDESFEVHTFKGKTSKVDLKPKYELVSTHTGRRTFATNLLLKGIPAQTVMLFTGHRDYKSFTKYVNIPKSAQMQTIKNALMS